ncbi:uncharacterized protein C8R40DRAFT_1069500 [Lentinula edodes]|uniref:uncharacterized protein n=1 Tax=Lentinula edodes TaxID=5353 RepID=UPI001E8CF4CF|nr:uncharacterized protein C8R40DRAFT_1069500 [Lentinula edodes]KAH7875500.1 hypothetical protein C8R40DRAFT_1069500 [Lentinula edodes]
MKFNASISSFLLVTYLAITVDAIALDEKLACGAPWNIGHSEGSSCKFWGKDDNGTHVHDGTCHKRSGFHVIHRYKCITTSVDLLLRSLRTCFMLSIIVFRISSCVLGHPVRFYTTYL